MKDVSLRSIAALALLTASALLVAVGCKGAASCSSDADCFAGEACVNGRCAVSEDEGDTDSTDATDDTSDQDTAEDADDDSTSDDATDDTGSDTAEDAGQDALDASTDGPACVVDKFLASCPDEFAEPNDSSTRGFELNDNNFIGCTSDDEFRAMSEEHSTWLCANESEDWYKAVIYPCDNSSFVVEARFTPRTECNRDLWEVGPSNYECSDQNISCSWEGETYVVRRFVEAGGGTATSYYFGIKKVTESLTSEQEVQLEYDVSFETRQ